MNERKRIARNTLLLYLRMFLMMAIGLFSSRVVLNSLGVEDYGIYNVVGGIVTMLGFLNGTLAVGTQRYITFALGKNDERLLDKTFSSALYVYIGLVIIVVLLAETGGLYFLNYIMVIPAEKIVAANFVYQCTILICIITFLRVPFHSTVIAHEKMDFFAYISIGEVLFKLILILSLSLASTNRLQIYAILMVLSHLFVFIGYLIYTKIKCQTQIKFLYDKDIVKSMFVFCGWNTFGSVAGVLSNQGVNILLNLFFGPVVNAARGVAMQVNSVLFQFVNNFQTAVNPQIIKLYAQENREEMFKLLTLNSKGAYILMCFLIIPFIVEMPYILKIWLGMVPDNTSLFCRIILLQTLVLSLERPFSTGIYATGHMKLANLLSGMLYMSILPICYIVLKMGMPAYGVFLVALFLQPIIFCADLYVFYRYTGFDVLFFLREIILRCIFIGVLAYVITNMVALNIDESFLRLCITTMISTCLIILLSWFLCLNIQEKASIKRIIKKKINKNGNK